MSTKKDNKTNNKKIHSIGAMPINPRTSCMKQCDATIANSGGLKEANSVCQSDSIGPILASNKLSPAKTSRNQVSANWNSVASTLKSQRTIPANKKIGKQPCPFLFAAFAAIRGAIFILSPSFSLQFP